MTASRPCPIRLCTYPQGRCEVDEMNDGAVDAEDFIDPGDYTTSRCIWLREDDDQEGNPMTEALDTQASDLVPAPPPPPSAVNLLRGAIVAMDNQRAEMVKRGDTTALAWGGAQVALVAADLADLQRQVRSDLAVLVEADYKGKGKGKAKLDIEGLGRVEIGGGWERKNWESAKLLRRLMMQAVADPETGELRDLSAGEMVEAIFEVLNDCLPITGSLNWRTGSLDKATQEFTGLKKYGVDDEDFCDRIDKPKLARIPKIVRSA